VHVRGRDDERTSRLGCICSDPPKIVEFKQRPSCYLENRAPVLRETRDAVSLAHQNLRAISSSSSLICLLIPGCEV
jgi:hypothetical protein